MMFFRILFHVSPQFFHECSKEVHVNISTDLIQNEPISDKTFRSNIGNRSSSYNIICIAKFACKKEDYLMITSLIRPLKHKIVYVCKNVAPNNRVSRICFAKFGCKKRYYVFDNWVITYISMISCINNCNAVLL